MAHVLVVDHDIAHKVQNESLYATINEHKLAGGVAACKMCVHS
jgi:hypothetical protein